MYEVCDSVKSNLIVKCISSDKKMETSVTYYFPFFRGFRDSVVNIILYIYSTFTKKTQWTHPRTGKKKIIPKELPFGWSKTMDEEGKTIYINRETGNKTYVDPRLAFAKEEKSHVHDFRQRFDGSTTAYQVNY